MEQTTRIPLAWELHKSGISNSQIARDLALNLALNREMVNRWIATIKETRLLPFLESYRSSVRKPRPSRQVPISVKQKVWSLRDREGGSGICGQKSAYFLEKEVGIRLWVPKISEILEEKYTVGNRHSRKRTKRGPVPEASAPRQVVQMDTIDCGKVFAFTAVDIFSREANVYLAPALTSMEGKNFLLRTLALRFSGFVATIQTNGSSEFEGEFAQSVGAFCLRHRVSRPYKKNEQAYIESFNRTVRAECLAPRGYPDEYRLRDIPSLQREADAFLERYHYHRPHLGLSPLRPPLGQRDDLQYGKSTI
jgi:transposase InsO family protein